MGREPENAGRALGALQAGFSIFPFKLVITKEKERSSLVFSRL